jgi:hypothetical protein
LVVVGFGFKGDWVKRGEEEGRRCTAVGEIMGKKGKIMT